MSDTNLSGVQERTLPKQQDATLWECEEIALRWVPRAYRHQHQHQRNAD